MTNEKRTLGSAIFADIDSNAYLGKLYARLLKGYGMHVFNMDQRQYVADILKTGIVNDDYKAIKAHIDRLRKSLMRNYN